jgi:hypothetical protein
MRECDLFRHAQACPEHRRLAVDVEGVGPRDEREDDDDVSVPHHRINVTFAPERAITPPISEPLSTFMRAATVPPGW